MEINWNGSSLFFDKSGSGNKIMLLFHGFGQDHSVFSDLSLSLSANYTCYSFDLFFHGKSRWNEARPLSFHDLEEFFKLFLSQENIGSFSVLGFSIGCRFLPAFLIYYSKRIEYMILVAPDGIVKNFWFTLATGSVVMRKFLQHLINHPRYFEATASLARKLKLMSPTILRFAEYQMATAEKRQRVFDAWTAFRKLRLPVDECVNRINEGHIKVMLIMGKQDPLIPSARLRKFIKGTHSIIVKETDAGHNRLLRSLPSELMELTRRNDIRH